MAPQPAHATAFRALHKPGKPLVLANVYDILSAQAVAKLPSCAAVATASYAVAQASGTTDEALTLETNLAAAKGIAAVALEHGKPLTVDLQDAYGERLEEAVTEIVKLGAVGVNLEDCDKATGKMYGVDEAVSRVKRVLSAAKKAGVPDFVVNARCDVFLTGGEIGELLERGKAYLAAGATTVFVFGGSKRGGVSRGEIVEMVKAFGGRLNVSLIPTPGNLTVRELAEIGVARISVGPHLQFVAMGAIGKAADSILKDAR